MGLAAVGDRGGLGAADGEAGGVGVSVGSLVGFGVAGLVGSVGGFVSYGCIRMLNADITDLYQRVSVGTTVVVSR